MIQTNDTENNDTFNEYKNIFNIRFNKPEFRAINM
jgi:hypothetical protein